MDLIYNTKIGKIKKIEKKSNILDTYNLDNVDALCINAPMGSGKTKNINNLIKKYKNIIFVTFRVTLINQLSINFKEFEKYSDIDDKIINLDIHNKVITTIDSLHRIVGECDLLIIDEFTYTLSHLVEYVKEREMVYSTLTQYLKNKETKVIALDALMTEKDVEFLTFFKENIEYLKYNYKLHDNKIIHNYNNNLGLFFNKITKDIEDNKKIYVCSNSKSHVLFFENILKKKYPSKKISCITSDNAEYFNIEEWDHSDIVLYSPSITAGISYEKHRFDTCYGFFINISAIAEMSIQQLFRIRNINSNEIHLCTQYMGRTDYDTDLENIKNLILNRDKCVVDGLPGIKFNCIKNEIIEDDYFNLFINNKRKIYLSRNNYNKRLIELLKSQGINNIKYIQGEIDKKINSEYKSFNKSNKHSIMEAIINSDDITKEEADLYKKDKNLNNENYLKLRKFNFKDFFITNDINIDKLKDFEGKKNIFNNLTEVHFNINNFSEFINDKINEVHDEKNNKNNVIRLHISKRYEKIALLYYFITHIGFNNIFDNKSLKINDNKIIDFFKKHEKMFKYLFSAKTPDINNFNIKDILKYINSRLRTVFGIYIKNIKNEYIIKGLEIWSKYDDISYTKKEVINRYEMKVLNRKEQKELDMIIKDILNSID